jgi:signal transduction histidine kinase
MAERIERFAWAATPLGAPETWSPSLKMMVRFLTANRFPLLLWWGPEFIQIYNDAYIPILGAKHPSPGLGRPVRECWSEIWGVLRPLIETPFRGGPATWMEDILLEVNRHGAKEETHFTIAYSPVPDDTVPGGIGGVLATVNEITDKVLAERRGTALRELAARLIEARTVDDACRIAGEALATHEKDVPFVRFYLLDENGTRACRASGPTLGPIDFCPDIIDLTAPSAWPAAALRTGTTQIVHGLGERVPGLPSGPWSMPTDSAVVVPLPSGRPGEFAGVMVAGLSAIRKLDALYRDFFEGIRSQVANAIASARAAEHERRRLEALAELDRAKMAFFSNVSHEFRTPLTLMLGPMEDVLAHSTLVLNDRNQLETVHRNSLRLLKLVNTMLDFSRIEAGRMETNCEELDLAAYTAELASVFRAAVERAGLKLVVNCPPLGQAAFVDRNMWEKIVLNLVSNALKFTLAGEIEVKLERKPGNGSVELTVRDTGIGIPSGELPRVFERFHRVKEARGRTHEGTGIGLALVQELARLHGGSIRCESELDRGSRFIVTLPPGRAKPATTPALPRALPAISRDAKAFAEEAMRWDGAPAPAGAPGPAAPRHSTPPLPAARPLPPGERLPRVVWADDNADMREYVVRLLSGRFEVVAVTDGLAALEAARAELPDLVLSDVMMPRLDGFGLLQAMRADPALQRVPVILLSARAGEEERVAGVGSGADDYLTKPFTAREVLARVEAH